MLKSNIVHINAMKSGYKRISYHGGMGVLFDGRGCAGLIFQEICAIDAINVPIKVIFFSKIDLITLFLVGPSSDASPLEPIEHIFAKFDVNWCVKCSVLESYNELM